MLDFTHAPTFLVEHQIIDDATDGQLRVLFDWIVLEIFVSAIAIDAESPVAITFTNPAAKGQSHRGTLDIQRLISFYNADDFVHIDVSQVGIDRFQKKFQTAAP